VTRSIDAKVLAKTPRNSVAVDTCSGSLDAAPVITRRVERFQCALLEMTEIEDHDQPESLSERVYFVVANIYLVADAPQT
jgi:hypothetical protein